MNIINLPKKILKFSLGSFIFLSVFEKEALSFAKITEPDAMSPSFAVRSNSNDYIILYKYNYLNTLLKSKNKSGELTYLNHPYKPDTQVVRFIIAKQGEWVKPKGANDVYHMVPEGHCWVECLNGEDDSTTWGAIPVSLLIGRPVVKIRPFSKIVMRSKIEKNIRKKLNFSERVLDESRISQFFV